MQLILAPMEGLADAPMRALLTAVGGYDWCVSEFVRINDRLLPARVFRRHIPETVDGFRTPAGVPVHVQLLGSDPSALADNAALVASLGAPAIDINFGCPAKTVNRHRGGAVLLEEPEHVHAIVSAVRHAVPAGVPVSAKMRLGYRDRGKLDENVRALVEGGASWLTVHARTKEDGYRPPAYWPEIARVRALAPGVMVIANGEVWTADDHARCVAESGCADVMLGRGAVASPGLALAIRRRVAGSPAALPDWPAVCRLQREFLLAVDADDDKAQVGRYKQWLTFMARVYPQAAALFAIIRPMRTRGAILVAIDASLAAAVSREKR
ncbi:MAG: tRNA dihydrouridine synthase [Gammaproteobacteria bacterium]